LRDALLRDTVSAALLTNLRCTSQSTAAFQFSGYSIQHSGRVVNFRTFQNNF